MPSPFPGMNPYFEQEEVWHDFHQAFIPTIRQSLVSQISPRYIVKLELHVYIRELASNERRFLGRADLGIDSPHAIVGEDSNRGILVAPVQCSVPTAVDFLKESYIEIRHAETRQLVTTIEVLSPANKYSGPDREAYLSKRRQILSAGNVNFVELDLLRGGPKLPLEQLPDCDYYAMVARVQDRPHVGVWPIQLRDPLPMIAIPLLPTDDDARLDLQELLHTTYDAGGYANYIYETQPEPRLRANDSEWAANILSAGAR